MSGFKNFLKKYLYILKVKDRFSPATQIGQRDLYQKYRTMQEEGKYLSLKDTGFRVFSQFEEDGILLYIFSLLGMSHKTFVEIGADDGVNSNCANLAFNFGWNGLFLDGNPSAIERGKRFYAKYPHPYWHHSKFRCARVTAENINNLISEGGLEGEIGLISIDIDGNDYWVWKAIDVVKPQVVIIETHIEFGMRNIVVPYDPTYSYPGKHPVYHGASPVAMEKLGKSKGYRLVGANDLGFNFIFLRNDLLQDALPEVSVESVLTHPSVKEAQRSFEAVKDWEYVEG